MRSESHEGILTVFLTGDIDALNAAEIQLEISEILKSQDDAFLVLDARELMYISSAGLRVLLHFQKERNNKISVINLSDNLMEIFKMAGFQYLMDIKGV